MTPAWSDAIGAALLHSLWQGALCAFLLAGALAGFRSSRTRYAAACAALNRRARIQLGSPRRCCSLAVGMLAAWQAPAPAAPKVTPYAKWLTEDVAYIAEDRERDAFRRLGTDEERQHFIAQFWDRRNPKPGSAENKAKREHYRRIAYANERFAAPKLAGWKNDRGRSYIVHGPPGELEKHPAEQREDWRYNAIEGLGKNVDFRFTDASKTGVYKLTRDPSKKPSPR